MFGKRANRERKRKPSKQAGREMQEIYLERENLLSEKTDFFIREAYKALRTNVCFSLTGDTPSKVILVTSALQGEGKSFTAANLAISFAQTEKRVLLIDCDLRRPKLFRLLRRNSEIGLSNVLMDQSLLERAILSTEQDHLSVLLSGDIPPNPSELLGSARMARLLELLKEHYDYIILDTPPINVVTDAVVLAPATDGVLFVVRAGQSERGSVMRAVEQLKYAGVKLLGFVMNDVTASAKHYGGYHYHYGYGYGYGYSNQDQRYE